MTTTKRMTRKKPATSHKQKRSSRDMEMMMIMEHENFTVQRDRSTETSTKRTRRSSRKHHSSTRRNISQRKAAASPEASKNRCRCPAGASKWYGHQEETITANIENETAEVSRASARRWHLSADSQCKWRNSCRRKSAHRTCTSS